MLALKKKKILGLQSRVPYVLARKTGKPAVIWKCDFIHVVSFHFLVEIKIKVRKSEKLSRYTALDNLAVYI